MKIRQTNLTEGVGGEEIEFLTRRKETDKHPVETFLRGKKYGGVSLRRRVDMRSL